MKDYHTATEYAAMIGVARQTVVEWCKNGILTGAYRVGARWRIPIDTPPPVITPQRAAKQAERPKAKTLALAS